MAGQPNEVMRFVLDMSDVQAKAARMQTLLEEIGRGRAAGADVTGLEEQLDRELKGLAQSTGKTKEAQSAIDQLIGGKEKLASVVGLLGGQFGGYIGQFANLAALARSSSRATLTVAAMLAGLTAIKTIIDTIGSGAKDATKSLDDVGRAEQLRQAAANTREAFIEKRRSAGIVGGIGEAMRESRAFQAEEVPIPREVAEFGVIAGDILERFGERTDENVRAAMAGFVAGGNRFSFSANQRDQLRELRQVMQLGRSPAAQDALRNYSRDMSLATQQGLLSSAENSEIEREAELQRIAREEGLGTKDVEYIRRLMARGNDDPLSVQEFPQVFGIYRGQAYARKPEGAGKLAPELVEIARRVRAYQRPQTPEIVVNVTNLQTQYVGQ